MAKQVAKKQAIVIISEAELIYNFTLLYFLNPDFFQMMKNIGKKSWLTALPKIFQTYCKQEMIESTNKLINFIKSSWCGQLDLINFIFAKLNFKLSWVEFSINFVLVHPPVHPLPPRLAVISFNFNSNFKLELGPPEPQLVLSSTYFLNFFYK